MKYIRAQDGSVVSVSQLLLPRKGRPGDKEIWRLSLITADGQRYRYAVYENMDVASEVYAFVVAFMRSSYSLLDFPLTDSDEFLPVVYEDRNEGLIDSGDAPAIVQEEGDTA